MAEETSSMYCALFGSMAVIHAVTPRRHICGQPIKGDPGSEFCSIPLDEGVHLHRPGRDAMQLPKRTAAPFRVAVC